MITFSVEGKPQGKARARTFYDKRSSKMRSITPEQTKSYENLIRWSYKAAGGKYMGDKPILIDILAVYEIPKSWSKTKQKQAEQGEILPLVKVDIDNCAKVVFDALNGVSFADDKQIVDLHIRKIYGIMPRLDISIDYL